MGVDYVPYAIIGVKVPPEKIAERQFVSEFKPEWCRCTPKHNNPSDAFCPKCGTRLMHKREVYIVQIPHIEHVWDLLDGWNGLDVVTDNGMDMGNFFFGFKTGGYEIEHGGSLFNPIPDLNELKEKIKKELEPLGLYDESTFGIHCVMNVG